MLKLLSKQFRFGIKYSRFYLQDLARDRVAEQRIAAEQKQKLRIQAVNNLPANDKNTNNRVSVRLNHALLNINPKTDYIKTNCWILQPKPVEIKPKVTISAVRKYIITSIKKARMALSIIKKMHVLDAINRLQRSHKKVAKLMVRTFYNLLDHAKSKGLNPLRLWVHGCIIGKTQRYKSLRYHAKGRGNKQLKDFCQVKIILYEKSEKDYYEQIALGQCAPGVANVVRYALKQHQADYPTLAKFTGVTTARGRQQAKLIFKRKIDKIMIENEQEGKYEPRKVIEARLREEEGERAKQKFALLRKQDFSTLRLRERQYKKNMGL